MVFVNVSDPSIKIYSQTVSSSHKGPWIIQTMTSAGPRDVLAVGDVEVKEGKGAQLTSLGHGWAIAGELGLVCCRDLECLGPDMSVFQFLRLDCCWALAATQHPVKVAFRVLDMTGLPRALRSGFAGIQSNIGFFYIRDGRKKLVRAFNGKRSISAKKDPGPALFMPHSLLQLF
jgi:hypothetical protein